MCQAHISVDCFIDCMHKACNKVETALKNMHKVCNKVETGLIHMQDDSKVLEDLRALVAQPPSPALEALSAQGCTGHSAALPQ